MGGINNMKTNVELANELSELVFNQNSFASLLKVMQWHVMNNKDNITPEQKVWAAFDFIVQPEFDRLTDFDLSIDTKNIITRMAYSQHENILKEFLIQK
jgi:hypothetical protein